MVYAENLSQPSVLDLARSGDFKAMSYLINSYLRPQGIYANVVPQRRGGLQIWVEFRSEPVADRIIKFICHLLWKLNSPRVEGVQIVGRFAGDRDILWKRSVRIVTPANRLQRRTRRQPLQELKFRTFRTLFLMGSSAVASLILGCCVSFYDVRAVMANQNPMPSAPEQAMVTAPPPRRSDSVQAALEVVPVVQHSAVNQPEDPTVTLMFGGDVTLSDSFEKVVGDDYGWAFEKLYEYRKADVAMVNLENPLTRSTLRRPNKQFNFKANPEAVQVLTEGGIDIVTLANNHAMDYEEPGLVETLETLEKAGIHAVGAGRNIQEARRPEIIEVKGQRIAYFGYYDADFHAAEEGVAGTNPRYNQRVAADIQAVRDQVDWVVVNYHWGVELAQYPGDWQTELARFTIDQGADLVVGHHPHVLQGAEIYKGRPIVYSLGNFIFGGNSRTDYDTAVLKVSLKADRKMKVEFLPVEVKQYQARVVQGKKGDRILQDLAGLSRIFDQPMTSPVVLEAPSQVIESVELSNSTSGSPSLPQISQETLPQEQSATSVPMPRPAEDQVNLPPKLTPTPSDPDNIKPYIQNPFIKDPFISIPPSTQPPETTSQSYHDSSHSISFALAETRSQVNVNESALATTMVESHSDIQLPELDQPLPLKDVD